MKKYICLVITLMLYIPICIGQFPDTDPLPLPIPDPVENQYDELIDLTITIEDSPIPNGGVNHFIQTHELSISGQGDIDRPTFTLVEKVGFRISIHYNSNFSNTFEYELEYFLYNTSTTTSSFISDEESIPSGPLRPVDIPPVDEDDDDEIRSSRNISVSEFPFIPSGENLEFNGLGQSVVELHLTLKKINGTPTNLSGPTHILQIPIQVVFSQSGNAIENTIPSLHMDDLKMYPNPIESILYIEEQGSIQQHLNNQSFQDNTARVTKKDIATIQIYTMQGIFIMEDRIQSIWKNGRVSFQFNNPDLKRGDYIYIITIDGKSISRIFRKE